MRKLLIIVVIAAIIGGGFYYKKHESLKQQLVYKTTYESDEFVRFDMEAYDSILQNYWAPHYQYDLSNFLHEKQI